MRSTNFLGLHDRAYDWLEKNCLQDKLVQTVIRDDRIISNSISNQNRTEITGEEVIGLCGETVHYLNRYTTTSGHIVYEVVQQEIWSGGPNIFLCLAYKHENDGFVQIKETKWTSEELKEYGA